MREVNWPELLIAWVLGMVAVELGGWLPRVAAWIVRRLARNLPARASRREAEWLDAVEETPGQWSKVIRALGFVPAAIAIQRAAPRSLAPVPGGSRGMRLLLRLTRAQAMLVFVLVGFLDVSWVLVGALSTSPVPLGGLLGLHLLAAFLYALNWRGLGVDWPWLRTSPQGAALMLALALWPFIYVPLVGEAPPTWAGAAWFATLHVLWAWEGYWDGRRPLVKRGVLGWKSNSAGG
ncbi:hypothetical protein [Deinococcus koreensis]|uniref:hypothetical protein n=1 Tax=Deinococcus koreensis TaxID=2054903 RepID=UPI0010572BC2|nr:hypothetical protein [Deinococcus koreensis]